MRFFLLSILLLQFLFAQELLLDNLLKEYEDSESLYKETKKESAGYLLVYSRDDLEKMQAYTLRDVLKTVRMYTTTLTVTGASKDIKTTAGRGSVAPIKLYIDNFEVTTALQANALDMYGDMDIYFVDHIEIYQGGSSIAFGNEPGSMVVRLYSKNPQRENSRSAQLSIDNKSGGNLRAVDAGEMGEYTYLFYADTAKVDFSKYTRNGQTLSRDYKRNQAHFKIAKKDDFEVELDGITTKTDIFSGFGSAPTGDSGKRSYAYINATKFFEDNLKLSVSASYEQKKFLNSDMYGFKLPDNTMANLIDVNANSNIYKAIIEKKVYSDKHDFLIGFQFQQNKINSISYNIDLQRVKNGPDKLNIYMLYLEELYNIDENNLLAFSAKLDYYHDNYSNDSAEYSMRLGYIAHLNEKFKTKVFAIRRYAYPTMLQTSYTPPAYLPNPNLKSTNIDMFTGEIEYFNKKNKVIFGYAHKIIDDSIVYSAIKKMYVNSRDTKHFDRYYIRDEYKFNLDNKIVLEFYKGFSDKTLSPASGGLVQMFNKIGKFDIYNELVYRESYRLNTFTTSNIKIDSGYDYTLSVSYPINKAIKIKLKGENLLDKASETLLDSQGYLKVPAIERRGMLTMEYTF
jgi:iron complex outermembrane receptor protein